VPKDDQEDKLSSIDSTLKEILKWTRFANISNLKEMLEKELNNDEKKLAYENSDGVRSLDEVEVESGAPRDTIYGWWQKWSRLGLVTESESRRGRMLKIVSLEDVGIKLPKRTGTQKGQAAVMSQKGTPQTTADKPLDPEEEKT